MAKTRIKKFGLLPRQNRKSPLSSKSPFSESSESQSEKNMVYEDTSDLEWNQVLNDDTEKS